MFETAALRPIYMVQLYCMRHAYNESSTWIVLCAHLQLPYNCRVCLKKCRRTLKLVLNLTIIVAKDNFNSCKFCMK